MSSADRYDVVIVGGGAAGLSAALVLGRARRRVAVVDAGSPRNAPAAHMQGYLSRDGMPPMELLAAGRAEVAGYGVELIEDRVATVDPGYAVRLDGGRVLCARRILLATGAHDVLPDIPRARERWGRDLLHCPYCHGWEVRDRPIGVLGTRPDAVEHALLVRQWSDDVAFFLHTLPAVPEQLARLTARGIRIVEGEVVRLIVEADRLTGVELAGGTVVRLDALFIRPVNVPVAGDILERLGCQFDGAGFPVVDPGGRTSVPGVWAAGNLVDPRLSVIATAGAASMAAMAINADLVMGDEGGAAAERVPRTHRPLPLRPRGSAGPGGTRRRCVVVGAPYATRSDGHPRVPAILLDSRASRQVQEPDQQMRVLHPLASTLEVIEGMGGILRSDLIGGAPQHEAVATPGPTPPRNGRPPGVHEALRRSSHTCETGADTRI